MKLSFIVGEESDTSKEIKGDLKVKKRAYMRCATGNQSSFPSFFLLLWIGFCDFGGHEQMAAGSVPFWVREI